VRPLAFILGGLILAFGFPPMPTLPTFDWPSVVTPVATVERATLVYEKDRDVVTPAVRAGISALNARGIVADLYELNPEDEVKPSYLLAVEAAKKQGTPLLVVMAGGKVIRTVKNPLTVESVTEAAK
jgi:hypothetical protein